MGIFDGIFNKSKNVSSTSKEVSMASKDLPDGYSINLEDARRISKVTHRDGVIQKVILARISKNLDGDTIFSDARNYISFEIAENQIITEEILLAAIDQYEQENLYNNRSSYLGRLQMSNDGISFGNKSKAVNDLVEKYILKNEELKRQEQEAIIQAQAEREKLQKAKDIERQKEKREFEIRRRMQRLENPTIEILGSRINESGKLLYDYNGTDMETGNYLKLRSVNKVCKDEKGTYLYSAYVDKAENEEDFEFISFDDEPMGAYVCFTLPGKLEDMINTNNMEYIEAVLNLLSDSKTFANIGNLSYIGGIEKDGNINREFIASSGIMNRIKNMQNEYKIIKDNMNFVHNRYDSEER